MKIFLIRFTIYLFVMIGAYFITAMSFKINFNQFLFFFVSSFVLSLLVEGIRSLIDKFV